MSTPRVSRAVDLSKGTIPIAAVVTIVVTLVSSAGAVWTRLGNIDRKLDLVAYQLADQSEDVDELRSNQTDVKDRLAAHDLDLANLRARVTALEAGQ